MADDMVSSILGAGSQLIGGGLSAIGGFMSGSSQKAAADRMRRMIRDYLQKTENKMDVAQSTELASAASAVAKAQRQAAKDYRSAQQRGDAENLRMQADPNYRAQAAFIQDVFSNGLPQSMTDMYAGQLRNAQAARGMEMGGAASRDEAAMIANMQFQAKAQMLPQMRQLAMDPFEAKQRAVTAELQALGATQQSSLQALQAQLAARKGAIDNANQFVMPLAQFGMNATQAMPVSSANPTANALGVLGSTFSNMFAGMGGGGLTGGGSGSGVPMSSLGGAFSSVGGMGAFMV